MKIVFKNLCETINEYLVARIQRKRMNPALYKLSMKIIEFSLKYRSWTPIPEKKRGYHDNFY
jgi:hypothetical protein